MLQALSLDTLPRIRHAFFTRTGGVSEGVYTSLNGGVGSNDAPDKVAENRARMAVALGVTPDRLLTAYQIHSPDVVIADVPWSHDNRPRADAIVTRTPALAIGVSTADCGPLLFADAQARVIGA
ncbi:MAG TPA: laccase domain-containing protein, partial [Pseudolabrys sp.]